MLTFRVAQRADTAEIVALVESAYRGEASRAGWTTEADLIDGQRTDSVEVSAILGRNNNYILLCESGKKLVGSMHLAIRQDHAYLGMFAVSPTEQGQGVGKAMLSYAESWVFNEKACNWLEMTVITQRKDLIGWYQRRGYEVTGKTRPFPYGDERYGRPRRDDLILEVLKKSSSLLESAI